MKVSSTWVSIPKFQCLSATTIQAEAVYLVSNPAKITHFFDISLPRILQALEDTNSGWAFRENETPNTKRDDDQSHMHKQSHKQRGPWKSNRGRENVLHWARPDPTKRRRPAFRLQARKQIRQRSCSHCPQNSNSRIVKFYVIMVWRRLDASCEESCLSIVCWNRQGSTMHAGQSTLPFCT